MKFWNKLWQHLICRGVVSISNFFDTSLHWPWMHDLKQSEYICEEFGISAICKIFWGCYGKLWILQFFVCQKEEFEDAAVTAFWVSSNLQNPSCASCAGLKCRIERWRFGSLCHKCIQIIFLTYDALTIVGRQFLEDHASASI